MMLPFEIRGYPMPPTSNSLYSNNPNGGRFKSMKYKEYEETLKMWCYKNQHQLNTARIICSKLTSGKALFVERNFYHKGDKIITKDRRPRKNDTTNRFKALDDTLSTLIGIDDCYFWSGTYTKLVSPHIALGEYVDLKFTVIDLPDGITEGD